MSPEYDIKKLQDTIQKMARLARISFPPEDLVKYTKKAQAVLTYVELLNALDTSLVKPTSHPLEEKLSLRPDQAHPWPNPQIMVEQAPGHTGNFFQVPKVLTTSGPKEDAR